MEKTKNILKQVLPWVVTIGILAFIFYRQDYHKIFHYFGGANIKLFVPVAALILITTYTLDCISQWLVLRWFCAPVKFKDVMVARGISFLLMIVNFNLGQGAMVYFFYRLTGKSLKRVAGAFFFTVFGDAYSWITVLTIGTVILIRDPRFAKYFVPFCAGAWIYWVLSFLYWRKGLNYKYFGFIRDWEIMSSFKEATFRHYAIMYVLRLPLYMLILFIFYLSMRSFGGYEPLPRFIVLMPLVLIISGLPIAVAGLGTTQMGWNFFFKSAGSTELGTALTLCVNFTMNIVNTLIAIVCLPFGKSFLAVVKQARAGEIDITKQEIVTPEAISD